MRYRHAEPQASSSDGALCSLVTSRAKKTPEVESSDDARIASGAAKTKLYQLIEMSNSFKAIA